MKHVVLTGLSGAGKSTVGPILADWLGLPFEDLDATVETQSGRSISQIFADSGEAGFRVHEKRALAHLLSRSTRVIACGGGALLDPESHAYARKRGDIVWLRVTPAVAARRLEAASDRPLLSGADVATRLSALLTERNQGYGTARFSVDTSRSRPDEVAKEIAEFWVSSQTLPVKTTRRKYDVLISTGGIGALGFELAKRSFRRVVIISDTIVAGLYGKAALGSCHRHGVEASLLTFAGGEERKTLATVTKLYTELMARRVDRSMAVVALGGGIVGDVAGFVAASWLRGVPLIQVPTTLLAQVDSSVGGKTGVNFDGAKNMVGAFEQPRFVFVPVGTLRTLSKPDYRAGLAELIKHAVIADPALLARVEAQTVAIRRGDPEVLLPLIAASIAVKRRIVEQDEHEGGLRKVLNFGHTFGHAIESASRYRLRHGEAVSLGMLLAVRLSATLGLCDPTIETRLRILLKVLSLPTDLNVVRDLPVEAHLAADKKREGAAVDFIALRRIGEVEIRRESFDTLESLLRSVRGSRSS